MMKSDAALSRNDENRTSAAGEAESASNALPATVDHVEAEPSAKGVSGTTELTEAALVVRAMESAGIDAKVKLLVKLALENLDGD
jgi:hypothetical protein